LSQDTISVDIFTFYIPELAKKKIGDSLAQWGIFQLLTQCSGQIFFDFSLFAIFQLLTPEMTAILIFLLIFFLTFFLEFFY
jgi:hypothetical protein